MSISKAEHDELCCVYAGLLLFDDKAEITAEKIQKIITASGNDVDAYYPEFFAKYLAGMDLNAFLNSAGAAPAGAPAQAAPADDKKGKGAEKKDAKKEVKKEAPKKEEEEEEGMMDMFG